jgi:hypothetical protein
MQTDVVTLKPGVNELRLTVQGGGQQGPGELRVRVHLTGSCAGTSRTGPGAAGRAR